jgi:triosephosphate isomerase
MIILINLKNYRQGKKVSDLLKQIQHYLPNSIVAVPSPEIKTSSNIKRLNIYSQHISPLNQGKGTGYLIPEEIKTYGAKGTLINHSEHPIPFKEIKKVIERCNSLRLKVIVFTPSLTLTKKLIPLSPYAIAYEDPKLVGSGKSITQYQPETIKQFVKLFKGKKTIPICGAGISTVEDIKQSKSLGCKGVAIASAIADSKKPKFLLKEIKYALK